MLDSVSWCLSNKINQLTLGDLTQMLHPSWLTSPMHFFNMLHTLKSLLENIGAGNDVLSWKKKSNCQYKPIKQQAIFFSIEAIYKGSKASPRLGTGSRQVKWLQSQRITLWMRTAMPQRAWASTCSPLISYIALCVYLCLLIPFSCISVSPLCFPVLLLWCGSRSSISGTLWFASEKSPEELSESKPV